MVTENTGKISQALHAFGSGARMASHPAPLAPPGKPSHSQTAARGDPLTWGREGRARVLSSVTLSVKMLSKLAAETAVSLSDPPPGEHVSAPTIGSNGRPGNGSAICA